MSDVSDLPLFGGPLAGPPPAPKPKQAAKKAKSRTALDLPPIQPQPRSNIVVFPISANVQIVEQLADTFLLLRAKHGRRCLDLLLKQHFRPLADRLRRLGVPPAYIREQLEDLEAAIADLIEIRESQASTGGHAA